MSCRMMQLSDSHSARSVSCGVLWGPNFGDSRVCSRVEGLSASCLAGTQMSLLKIMKMNIYEVIKMYEVMGN